MRSVVSWLSRKSLAFGLPLLAACATGAPGVMGTTDNLVHEGTGTPHITLIEHPLRDGVVDGTFLLDGPGYAMVVAMDLDGQVRVVYPEAPTTNGLLLANQSQRIAPFFAGLGRGSASSTYWDREYSYRDREYSYSPGYRYYRPTLASFQPGVSRSRGAVYLVAIASARPLQLDRLRGVDGEWDARMLHSVVFDADPSFVGTRLGHLVVAPNQEFTTDYRVIADGRASPLYVSSAYGVCGRRTYGSAYGNAYGVGYYGSPILGFDPYLSPSTLFVTGIGDANVGLYAGRGMCGRSYLWTEQPEQIRRPSPLFPNDTSLLFTTRRLAARVPGSGGIGLNPSLPAVGGDVRNGGNGGPELSRGPAKARTEDPPAARAAPASASSRSGQRH